jgi:hypothetical protein
MPDISITLRGLEPFRQYVDALKRGLRGKVTEETANILVEDYLRPYPPYQYVTRKQAYGKTFQSDAQRRFVMAAIRDGRITPGYPRRAGNLARSWRVIGDGVKARIIQEGDVAPHGQYVVGPNQAAQPYHVGWVKAKYTVDYNIKAATEKAQAAVDRWMQEIKK